MNKTNNKQITKIFALGGLEEVGKNTYCIEHNEEIIIIDAGIKFPEKILLGVDAIIPDYKYLIKNEKKIAGIFVTHGHEDHIGGIPHLLKKVKVPKIYSPLLASDLIKAKIKKCSYNPKIIEYDSTHKIQLKNFTITFFRVTHSVPNSYGIIIKTPNGTVVTTGDYKLDWTPLNNKTELDRITKIGSEGVSLLLSDSTNSEVEGYTTTEKTIIENISFLLKNSPKRILVTTFASNFDRIFAIILAARKANRKVAIFGKSIQNILKIIKKRKYFEIQNDIFIDESNLNRYKPKEIVMICTGSQGETNSVITKIANGIHPIVKGGDKDMVIFSSKPIPGNFYDVENVINKLEKRGIQVKINSKLNELHTSGHACQEEQKIMLSLMKPDYFMPIHGEYRMLKIHGETARKIGIPKENIFICRNGDQIYLYKNKAWMGDYIPVDTVFLGKNQNQEETLNILKERQLMLKGGVICLIILIDYHKKILLKAPQFIVRGSFYMKKETLLNHNLMTQLNKNIQKYLSEKEWNKAELEKKVKELISLLIYESKKINPLVETLILFKK